MGKREPNIGRLRVKSDIARCAPGRRSSGTRDVFGQVAGLSVPVPASSLPARPVSGTTSGIRGSADRRTGYASRCCRPGALVLFDGQPLRGLGGEQQGRNCLVGVEGVAVRIYRHGGARIRVHVHGFLVKAVIESARERCHCGFDHRQSTTRFKYTGRLLEEFDRALEMMQDIEHHHAGKESVSEWQAVSIRDDVNPGEFENIGGNDLGPDCLMWAVPRRGRACCLLGSFRAAVGESPDRVGGGLAFFPTELDEKFVARPIICAFRMVSAPRSNSFELAISEPHHFQQQPAIAKPRNLVFAEGARPVVNRGLYDF